MIGPFTAIPSICNQRSLASMKKNWKKPDGKNCNKRYAIILIEIVPMKLTWVLEDRIHLKKKSKHFWSLMLTFFNIDFRFVTKMIVWEVCKFLHEFEVETSGLIPSTTTEFRRRQVAIYSSVVAKCGRISVQVDLCQKLLFLHQLTQNIAYRS